MYSYFLIAKELITWKRKEVSTQVRQASEEVSMHKHTKHTST